MVDSEDCFRGADLCFYNTGLLIGYRGEDLLSLTKLYPI